jgi:hypothetical protein
MVSKRRILLKVLAGSKNIRFNEIVTLAEGFGFRLARISGSHHIFTHPDVDVPVNLQEVNGCAKPYQVRQLMKLVEEHDLSLENSQ